MGAWLGLSLIFFGLAAGGAEPPVCAVSDLARLLPGSDSWLVRHSVLKPVQNAFDRFMGSVDADSRDLGREMGITGFFANGENVAVGNITVSIERMLGVGGEGAVYLVRGPSGPMTLKVFFNRRELTDNLTGMNKHAARHLRTPSLLATDVATRRVLFQYVRGIPVDALLESPEINAGARHVIRKKFEELENTSGVALEKGNVILEVSSGNFYVIDSR